MTQKIDIPANPFEISTHSLGLHDIIDRRDELLFQEDKTQEEILELYYLRVQELLTMLDMSYAHLAWAEEDFDKLKEKVGV